MDYNLEKKLFLFLRQSRKFEHWIFHIIESLLILGIIMMLGFVLKRALIFLEAFTEIVVY